MIRYFSAMEAYFQNLHGELNNAKARYVGIDHHVGNIAMNKKLSRLILLNVTHTHKIKASCQKTVKIKSAKRDQTKISQKNRNRVNTIP